MKLNEILSALNRLDVEVHGFRADLKLALLAEDRVTDAEREAGLASISARVAGFIDTLSALKDEAAQAERDRPVIEEPIVVEADPEGTV